MVQNVQLNKKKFALKTIKDMTNGYQFNCSENSIRVNPRQQQKKK